MTSEISQHNSSATEQQCVASLDTGVEIGTVDRYQPFMHPFDVLAAKRKWLPSQRRMHKVPWALRMQEQQNNPSVYEPLVVSLGPYHHGKKEFSEVDEFKHLCLHWCADGSDERKGYLYSIVLNMIDQVRGCYSEVSIVNKYDDNNLALMMLLDASFIINFMKIRDSDVIAKDSYNCLGVAAALPFTARDIMLLENQIPFTVLKLLVYEIYGTERAQIAIEKFLSGLLSIQTERAIIPCEYHDPPIHILEACRRILAVENELIIDYGQSNSETAMYLVSSVLPPQPAILKQQRRCDWTVSHENTRYASKDDTSFLISSPSSVTYLKSKGIRVCQNSSHFLKDIEFKSCALYGELELPVCYVSNLTLIYLSNMIAYEVAPNNTFVSPDLAVLSYTNFMKALIQTPADVIELQQKGILRINRFANHEQVVNLFQSIDTFNLRNATMYQDVMLRVAEHCNSKAKTWMADLIHGKLNNPWTIIALFSATMLLCLTFLQTIFTIHPAR